MKRTSHFQSQSTASSDNFNACSRSVRFSCQENVKTLHTCRQHTAGVCVYAACVCATRTAVNVSVHVFVNVYVYVCMCVCGCTCTCACGGWMAVSVSPSHRSHADKHCVP